MNKTGAKQARRHLFALKTSCECDCSTRKSGLMRPLIAPTLTDSLLACQSGIQRQLFDM
jgi:hypothetical protein